MFLELSILLLIVLLLVMHSYQLRFYGCLLSGPHNFLLQNKSVRKREVYDRNCSRSSWHTSSESIENDTVGCSETPEQLSIKNMMLNITKLYSTTVTIIRVLKDDIVEQFQVRERKRASHLITGECRFVYDSQLW